MPAALGKSLHRVKAEVSLMPPSFPVSLRSGSSERVRENLTKYPQNYHDLTWSANWWSWKLRSQNFPSSTLLCPRWSQFKCYCNLGMKIAQRINSG